MTVEEVSWRRWGDRGRVVTLLVEELACSR